MDSNADEIHRAASALGFKPGRFRRLPAEEAWRVYQAALRHFVPEGEPRWWWDHFPKSTHVHFTAGDGWRHLTKLVPDSDERVWFIAEDFEPPEYSVWEASVRDIQAVLGECYCFEFYLVQQQHRWLVCENHHDVTIAVGKDVEERLSRYRAA